MTVKSIGYYKDGGTFSVETDQGTFYIDGRFGNPINPHKGFVFNDYPERGNIVTTVVALELREALSASKDRWADMAMKAITHDLSF